ncbi:unnamed protein product [Heterosigma akashiwo]
MLVYYKNNQNLMNDHVELVHTHHVPPYGYGKSHGWTKIIRIINSPLLVETIELLQASDPTLSLQKILKLGTPLSEAMRQVIRFHCRISHVAAHTFMYNLDLSSHQLHEDVLEAISLLIEGNLLPGSQLRHDDRMKEVSAYLNRALAVVPISDTANQLKGEMINAELVELSKVLNDELTKSNNLKQWPCLSFWAVSGGVGNNGDDILSENAKKTVADCNAPFTSWFCQKDKCEMEGNAACV